MKLFLIFMATLFLISCEDDCTDSNIIQSQPNILLIIADDMGLDATPGYDVGSIKPNMPVLDSLIMNGLRFENLWSFPTCTPTRSSIMTGKYGFRIGVTKVDDELSTEETSLQSYLDENADASYNHAVIGKWHLSNDPAHPMGMGVGTYAGLLTGGVSSYWDWNFTSEGQTNTSTEYTTTKFTDLAIDWIDEQDQPWFLWLAYNAPHKPFHLPPSGLHTQSHLSDDQASIDAAPTSYYMAMLEAMDTEIGRLLKSMSLESLENTTIIFIGDNGSPGQVAQDYNQHRTKGTVYQGGINVPMVVSGAQVNRLNESETALINTTDLFATIANLAGSGITEIHDSQSFAGLLSDGNSEKRHYVYSEAGHGSNQSDYTIRNSTHKYISFEDGSESLYDLSDNPLEQPDLLRPNQLPLSPTDSLILAELLIKLDEIRQ